GCVVALASALGVVIARRPVYAAIFLLLHSLSLAALFGVLFAAMVAVGQVLIYSGAIVVLFLFVVTLLPSGGRELGVTGNRIGAAGALLHRHPVAMLMAVELMLNAANLLIVLGARVRGGADAEAAALIVLVLAAAEAVIGLALALALFRRKTVPDVDDAVELRG